MNVDPDGHAAAAIGLVFMPGVDQVLLGAAVVGALLYGAYKAGQAANAYFAKGGQQNKKTSHEPRTREEKVTKEKVEGQRNIQKRQEQNHKPKQSGKQKKQKMKEKKAKKNRGKK